MGAVGTETQKSNNYATEQPIDSCQYCVEVHLRYPTLLLYPEPGTKVLVILEALTVRNFEVSTQNKTTIPER